MDMHISNLVENLSQYQPKVYINREDITNIKYIKYLEPGLTDFDLNTLYVGDMSNLEVTLDILTKGNILIVSEASMPTSISTNDNFNIIFISGDCVLAVFNKVLDIFSEYIKLTEGSSKLLETLSQGNGIQEIINMGFQLIGNPIFVRDISFSILAFTQDVMVDDYVWKELTSKGYQPYDGFQYLMKNGFIESTNNVKIPVYFKNMSDAEYKTLQKEKKKINIEQNKNYMLRPTFDLEGKVKISRLWSNIFIGNKVIGQVVVLEAFKPFSETDMLLIKSLSDTVSLELQKHKYYENLDGSKLELLIVDLLDGKVKDQETLEEKLKFVSWNLKKNLRVIVVTTNQKEISNIPIKYVSGFFENVFGNAICVLYERSIVVVVGTRTDKKLSDIQLEKLKQFMKDTGMFSGVSRNFCRLLDLRKYYKQALDGISAGKHLKKDMLLFFYDDYILQNMFDLCSGQEALKEFCHPSIFTLMNYDCENKTNYLKILQSYIMSFKNQSELAASMHVHRNTLYYRISKIEEIMNVDLNDIDDFFSIYLSFKILEYLE
ncbi:PucR family transcriptional regulator [Clostridium thailandense]|uniref:PucR family transcriptional regulator n=1 Tax=Clostridium thailandense TaxID=2794346 RepID=UPI0039896508